MNDLKDNLITSEDKEKNLKIDITKPLAYFISFVFLLILIKIICINI